MHGPTTTHDAVPPRDGGAGGGGPDPFLCALHADGPARSLGEAAALYAPLIGSWEVDVVDFRNDGTRRESRGEWHFGWVLEGRAVQDVWIAPPRRARRSAALPVEGNRYGTSIRVYDPQIAAWRVTWFNPVSQAEDRLIARREGANIVQEGRRADVSRIRWTFSDLTADSFTWRGERSTDDGKSWRLEAEFFGRRIPDPPRAEPDTPCP